MFAALRDHLTPRRVLLAIVLLLGAALLLPWTPTYRPLREAMTQRHLEARGRSPEQLRQLEAARRQAAERQAAEEATRRRNAEVEANRRAAEERARQQAAEAEARRRAVAAEEEERRRQAAARDAEWRQAKAQEHRNYVGSFQRLAQRLLPIAADFETQLNNRVSQLAKLAREGGFHSTSIPTADDIATQQLCSDPTPAGDRMTPADRRKRNIYACAVHLSVNPVQLNRFTRLMTVALMYRVTAPEQARSYTLDRMLVLLWFERITTAVQSGEFLPPDLPEMYARSGINTDLFTYAMPRSFAVRLLEGVSQEEQSMLFSARADLARLQELGTFVVGTCRELRRTDCLAD